MHIQCANTVSRSTSLGLIAFFLAACTCKPFVWDSKPGVTSYILLYEPVLKRADKSFREDVWSTEDEKQHTVQSLWDPGPKSGQDSGLSIISFDPGRLGGSQLRASTDSRGLKKSDTSAQCCLESNMSNALQRYYFSYLLPTISTERAQRGCGWCYQHGFFRVCIFSQSGVDQRPVQGVFRQFVAVNRKWNESLTTA